MLIDGREVSRGVRFNQIAPPLKRTTRRRDGADERVAQYDLAAARGAFPNCVNAEDSLTGEDEATINAV